MVSLFTIQLCIQNYRLSKDLDKARDIENRIVHLYDTIYIPKPYELDRPHDVEEKPIKVVVFDQPTDTISTGSQVISIDLQTDILKLSTLVDSVCYDNYYNLDLYRYQYRYVNGEVSKSKVPLNRRLLPYLELNYRLLNSNLDLSGGISFKTKNFNYKLGLNLYYYPNISREVKLDLAFGIVYNF